MAYLVPLYANEHVPPVEGMTFLGTFESKNHETYDVYFIPGEGFPAVTLVWGLADWQWESDSVSRIRAKQGVHASGFGPYHFGFKQAVEKSLL